MKHQRETHVKSTHTWRDGSSVVGLDSGDMFILDAGHEAPCVGSTVVVSYQWNDGK